MFLVQFFLPHFSKLLLYARGYHETIIRIIHSFWDDTIPVLGYDRVSLNNRSWGFDMVHIDAQLAPWLKFPVHVPSRS